MNYDVRVKKQEDITSIQFGNDATITKRKSSGICITNESNSIMIPPEMYKDLIIALIKAEDLKWVPNSIKEFIAPIPRVMLNEQQPGANLYGSWIPENTVTYNQQTKRGE